MPKAGRIGNYSPEKLRRLERLLARVDLDRGMTVLDAGCGQGVLLPFLRRRVGGEGRLIALDASAACCVAPRNAIPTPGYCMRAWKPFPCWTAMWMR